MSLFISYFVLSILSKELSVSNLSVDRHHYTSSKQIINIPSKDKIENILSGREIAPTYSGNQPDFQERERFNKDGTYRAAFPSAPGRWRAIFGQICVRRGTSNEFCRRLYIGKAGAILVENPKTKVLTNYIYINI